MLVMGVTASPSQLTFSPSTATWRRPGLTSRPPLQKLCIFPDLLNAKWLTLEPFSAVNNELHMINMSLDIGKSGSTAKYTSVKLNLWL